MKLLSLLFIASVLCFTAMGQPFGPEYHREHVEAILKRQSANAQASKTTGVYERVVAASTYMPSFWPIKMYDSARYAYSTERGSSFDFGAMAYDASYLGSAPATTGVLCDSYTRWKINGNNTALNIAERHNSTYNFEKQVTGYWQYLYNNNQQGSVNRYVNSFDAQNTLLMTEGFNLTGTSWHSFSRSYYYYDAQGLLTTDSTFMTYTPTPELQYVTRNYYLPGGLLDSSSTDKQTSGWTHYSDHVCRYYATGQLMTSVIRYNSDPNTQMKDSFAYDAANQSLQLKASFKFNGNWYETNTQERHLNIAGLPDTIYAMFYNTGLQMRDTFYWESFQYNASGLPVTTHRVHKYSTGLDHDRYYYYEPYTTGIKTAGMITDLNIYPNPTNNIITITSTQLLAKNLHIQLYNTMGQLLINDQLVWSNNSYQLSLAGYGEGMYWVVIKDEAGAVLCSKSILKK